MGKIYDSVDNPVSNIIKVILHMNSYTVQEVANALNIDTGTFYTKMKRGSFSAREFLEICSMSDSKIILETEIGTINLYKTMDIDKIEHLYSERHLDSVSNRDNDIIQMHKEGYKLKDIGLKYGISAERVRQIIKKHLDKIPN